jgi:ubiquinone/menaquinone biosynthesis C-methylase UbiE
MKKGLAPDRNYIVQAKGMRPAERLYLQRLLRRVHDFFPPQSRVLDAGCGQGHLSMLLHEKGCRMHGLDLEPHPNWGLQATEGLMFSEGSLEKLAFPTASFDGAVVKDVLHHMANPQLGLRELNRVVKPNGPIVVMEANRYNPVFYLHLTLFGQHQHFSHRRFRELVSSSNPEFLFSRAESRCLPWDHPWLLFGLEILEEFLERTFFFQPWLTYHLALLPAQGK